uniref:Uncharacterized protein n=1 Tax=Anopheles maculatus TaxID=74869 RepID=A0A182SFB7_9DIPT
NYSDDQSTIKNTLNNTNLAYYGDYQRPQSTVAPVLALLKPVATTRSPTNPTKKRRKKKPNTSVLVPTAQQVSLPAELGALGTPPSDTTKTELTPETLSLLSRYYSFSCTLTPTQPSEYPTRSTLPPVSTTRRTKTRYLSSTRPTKVKTTTKRPKKPNALSAGAKQKKPVVYVDPPVIKRIGGMLESVYTFMENALTSTEYVEDSEETRAVKRPNVLNDTSPKRSKVKRNTYPKVSASGDSGEIDAASRSTLAGTDQTWLPVANDEEVGKITKQFTPKLVTISGLPSTLSTDGNKNKMTTNIQVTSEYTAATPPTVTLGKPRPDDSADYDDSSEEGSDEDYFGGFGGGFEEADDDEDDDEEEDDEDDVEEYGGGSSDLVRPNRQTALTNDKDYEEVSTHLERPVRIKRVKKRRRKKRPAVSYEDSTDYSDEDASSDEYDDRDESNGEDDEDDDYESGESPDDAEGFFSRMFSSFGRFVRSLGFGAAARGTPDDYDEYDGGNARSTTPRVQSVRRRPTRSTSGDAALATPDERYTAPAPPSNWLGIPDSYLINDLEEEIVEPVVPTFEIPATVAPSAATTSSGWFEMMMPWDFFNPWTSDTGSPESVDEQEVLTTKPPAITN